jgi:hypothetical protein
MLANKKVIGMITETTQGTPATLAATSFFRAFDIEGNVKQEMIEQNYQSSSLDPFPQIPGKSWQELKFKRYLQAYGTAGTPNMPLSALLQACGMVETTIEDTSVTYAPSSNPVANFLGAGKSATIKLYEEGSASLSGLIKTIAGAMGNTKLIIDAGKPVIMESDFKGLYTTVADGVVPTNSPISVVPPIVVSATFTTHTYAATIQKMEIDLGNEINELPDVNSATGILGFQTTGRKPKGSIDPQAVLVATHDFYGKVKSGDLGIVTIVIGSATVL